MSLVLDSSLALAWVLPYDAAYLGLAQRRRKMIGFCFKRPGARA
jgi:hypothetical protein